MRIHTIDLFFQGHAGLIASFALETAGGITLIETGPGSCHAALLAGLEKIGATVRDVQKIFVTHIHLDHSGAAGWWAQQGATVYVHGRGAAHLIDPAKLIQSATQIYAEQMGVLWGEVLPAPAAQVQTLADGAAVRLDHGLEIRAWDTPGHASHHLVYSCGDLCFSGDQAGMLYPGTRYLSVTSAPPQFEPREYIQSVKRLEQQSFRELYLSHFGLIQGVQAHWKEYAELLQTAAEKVLRWVQSGYSSEQIHAAYLAAERERAAACGLSEENWQLLELANSTKMCSAGIERWARKQTRLTTCEPC
jgi:glyoxylase-like metal-dependent hydrolase (beta-lactamase superfamily II)